jgi:crotonobetainyl-CoA:carnitine CoA-transferase CaiB-like acyl-CoA transferase
MDEPLSGIKVLDLSRLLPGPYCTMLLADMGAEVLKVEEPYKGDYMRQLIPGVYESVNRNKRSLTLNLKSDKGREIFCDMAAGADVIVEGFRPGVTEKLKLDYPVLQKINPGIIYCSISGYGQDGPYRLRPGHDINYLGLSGVLSIPGELNKDPSRPGLPLADLSSGLFAAFAIQGALLQRKKTGKGQYIDVAINDILVSWMGVRAGMFLLGEAMPSEPEDFGHLSPANAQFTAGDNRKLTIAALEDNFWKQLCKALSLNDFLENSRYESNLKRIRHASEIYDGIQEAISTKSRDEWIAIFDEYGVPSAPVNSYDETVTDPQVVSRGLVAEIPYRGNQKLKQIANPIKFSRFQPRIYLEPPEKGQHTDDVMFESGYSKKDLEALRERGVV